MTSGEEKKDEQQTPLNQQHLDEWNAQMAQETRVRIALKDKHKQEATQSYLEEINFHDRPILQARQQQAVSELAQQNKRNRIDMLKRHAQENNNFNQQLD